jgi:anti-sigma B factor antagonist
VNLETDENGPATVLRVQETRIDAHSAPDLKVAIAGLVAARRNVLIDLSRVEFMDSSGLSALISGLKAANALGGSVKLSGLRPHVKSMFELTRLHRVFEIFPEADEAARSFNEVKGAP